MLSPVSSSGSLPAAMSEPQEEAPKLRTTVSTTFRDAMADPDSEAYNSDKGMAAAIGFIAYTAAVFIIAGFFATLSVGLWSEMGCGDQCLGALRSVQGYSSICVGLGMVILLTLFLFDFFCPPHLPGKNFVLWEGDRFVGRGLFVLAILSFVAATYLSADKFPTVPLLVSIFLSPLCVLVFRWVVQPQDLLVYSPKLQAQEGQTLDAMNSAESEKEREQFEQRMHELRQLTGDAKDQQSFYKAAAYAYAAVGALCVMAFCIWLWRENFDWNDDFMSGQKVLSRQDRELRFIRFAAPVTVAISNFLFSALMAVRVVLHRTYAHTDEARNRLVVEAASTALGKEIMKHRMTALSMAYSMRSDSEQALAEMQGKVQEYLVQQSASIQRLTTLIKLLNVALLVVVGCIVIAMQFAMGHDSNVSTFTQGYVTSAAIIFALFVFVAFGRIRRHLSAWLQDMPLWKTACSAASQSPARAAFFVALLPFSPIVLVLAAANQGIRRCRGITSGETTTCAKIFGKRIDRIVADLCTWDWLVVGFWCYVLGVVVILGKATPVFLNTFLAWLSDVMADWNFGVIVGMTWAIGMLLFMLPPVPGPPIYLFGGFVLTEKCPWGFWWGAVANVALSFVLKLTACAVQQKVIGGTLSNNMWVRQTCGVHTPLMRAIENVLRKPGLSAGKVMILCGGPDWPTSVMAGILRTSLLQCLLGTTPIILAVAPLALSGSFYLRKNGYGDMWARLGNFMFILSGVVTMAFWAGCAWAVQEEFAKNQEALNTPREEFVDLEWLSYLNGKVSAKTAVKWREVPRVVLAPFVVGMLGMTFAANLFMWQMQKCLGTFDVDGDISTLKWLGQDGLIMPMGLIGFAVVGASLLGLVVYKVWQTGYSRGPRAEALKEFGAEEAEWKATRRHEARAATAKALTSATVEDPSAQEVASLCRSITEATLGVDGAKKADAANADMKGAGGMQDDCVPGLPQESSRMVEM